VLILFFIYQAILPRILARLIAKLLREAILADESNKPFSGRSNYEKVIGKEPTTRGLSISFM
jgi:hypothetical protein